MKTLKCLVIAMLLGQANITFAQEKLEIQGAVIIGNSEDASPAPGTIRYNATIKDFEGWNGSKWISLSLGPCGGLNFVKDVDNNSYKLVAIGDQCWMAENLKTAHYSDTTSIPNIQGDVAWSNLSTPGYTFYDNNPSNKQVYGALYNWYAVDSSSNGNKNICPAGFHIPSEAEYTILIDLYGGESIAGIKLKEAGNFHFLTDNKPADNLSGFTAIPAGYRFYSNGLFYEMGYYADFWTKTSTGSTSATFIDMEYDGDYANTQIGQKKSGYSVRCIKD